MKNSTTKLKNIFFGEIATILSNETEPFTLECTIKNKIDEQTFIITDGITDISCFTEVDFAEYNNNDKIIVFCQITKPLFETDYFSLKVTDVISEMENTFNKQIIKINLEKNLKGKHSDFLEKVKNKKNPEYIKRIEIFNLSGHFVFYGTRGLNIHINNIDPIDTILIEKLQNICRKNCDMIIISGMDMSADNILDISTVNIVKFFLKNEWKIPYVVTHFKRENTLTMLSNKNFNDIEHLKKFIEEINNKYHHKIYQGIKKIKSSLNDKLFEIKSDSRKILMELYDRTEDMQMESFQITDNNEISHVNNLNKSFNETKIRIIELLNKKKFNNLETKIYFQEKILFSNNYYKILDKLENQDKVVDAIYDYNRKN